MFQGFVQGEKVRGSSPGSLGCRLKMDPLPHAFHPEVVALSSCLSGVEWNSAQVCWTLASALAEVLP